MKRDGARNDSPSRGRNTVSAALTYLRDTLKVVNWVKGWGNAHGNRANSYTLDFEIMNRLATKVHFTGKKVRCGVL